MNAAGSAPADRQQLGPLVRLFVARFFENDLTASAGDLRRSFFGLLAILGIPGALVPFLMSFTWTIVGQFQGVYALRLLSRTDKELYLGFAMTATAALAALTWDTLLIDSRDGIVLGSLPVRPRTIISAKLVALAVYIGAIGLTMHVMASLLWGLTLATGKGSSFEFFLRGVAGHFIAGCGATAFVILLVMAVQGTLLCVLGPRAFARISSVFQVALVVAVGLSVFLLPQTSLSVSYALERPVDPATRWVLSTPPVWFLGVYEWCLGGVEPVVDGLAQQAAVAFIVVFVIAIVTNVVAFRRVLAGAVGSSDRRRAGLSWPLRLVAHMVSRRPELRAVAEFFLTSVIRVERQRLALAIGAGVAIAWAVPTLREWPQLIASPKPSIELLTLPLSVMVLMLVAVRVAASLPADLKASWVFDMEPPDAVAVRGVIERLLLIAGVAPFVLGSSALASWRWGADVGLTHLFFSAALGVLVVELLMRGLGYVPGTQPWRPEHARLRARWPIYLLGFLWLADGLPIRPRGTAQLEWALIHDPNARLFFLPLFAVIAFEVRRRSIRTLRTEPAADPDVPEGAPAVLRLH